MFVVTGRFRVREGKARAFIELSVAHAQQSLLEPGCLLYHVAQHRDDPAFFTFYEIFRGEQDYTAHRKTPHLAAFKERVIPLVIQTDPDNHRITYDLVVDWPSSRLIAPSIDGF